MIKDNIEKTLKTMEQAAIRSNHNPSDITLITVSKTKPMEQLMEAYATGIRDFGENKVQELCEKMEVLPKDIRWHMIGHLQRNKVKYIVGKVHMIHSVDSYRLAETIDLEAKKKGINVDILIEVNIADEETKYGVLPEDLFPLIQQISSLSNIRIKGLMTVAPYTENASENRSYFKKMHQLYVDINKKNIDNICMEVLSMGMTGDYEIAIEEGATMVRVGTGIFGERNYNID